MVSITTSATLPKRMIFRRWVQKPTGTLEMEGHFCSKCGDVLSARLIPFGVTHQLPKRLLQHRFVTRRLCLQVLQARRCDGCRGEGVWTTKP